MLKGLFKMINQLIKGRSSCSTDLYEDENITRENKLEKCTLYKSSTGVSTNNRIIKSRLKFNLFKIFDKEEE